MGVRQLGRPIQGVRPGHVLRVPRSSARAIPPEDSLYPFLLALSLLATFYGLLTALWPLAIAGAALVAAMTIGWLWPAPPPEERVA